MESVSEPQPPDQYNSVSQRNGELSENPSNNNPEPGEDNAGSLKLACKAPAEVLKSDTANVMPKSIPDESPVKVKTTGVVNCIGSNETKNDCDINLQQQDGEVDDMNKGAILDKESIVSKTKVTSEKVETISVNGDMPNLLPQSLGEASASQSIIQSQEKSEDLTKTTSTPHECDQEMKSNTSGEISVKPEESNQLYICHGDTDKENDAGKSLDNSMTSHPVIAQKPKKQKARKSCQSASYTVKQSEPRVERKAPSPATVANLTKKTIKMTDLESVLGIKNRSLDTIDAKTLDKLVLQKAQQHIQPKVHKDSYPNSVTNHDHSVTQPTKPSNVSMLIAGQNLLGRTKKRKAKFKGGRYALPGNKKQPKRGPGRPGRRRSTQSSQAESCDDTADTAGSQEETSSQGEDTVLENSTSTLTLTTDDSSITTPKAGDTSLSKKKKVPTATLR